jgi:hypothetical protein
VVSRRDAARSGPGEASSCRGSRNWACVSATATSHSKTVRPGQTRIPRPTGSRQRKVTYLGPCYALHSNAFPARVAASSTLCTSSPGTGPRTWLGRAVRRGGVKGETEVGSRETQHVGGRINRDSWMAGLAGREIGMVPFGDRR